MKILCRLRCRKTWSDAAGGGILRKSVLMLAAGLAMAGGMADRAAAAPDTLRGRVMCGYQGWFAAEGDGLGRGWQHYGFGGREGECHIDLWPDLSEYGEDEKFPTPLKHADGSTARVFSSAHPATVRRHFEWMREYGIDGVFLQRFGVSVRGRNPAADGGGGRGRLVDRVLANVRAAAPATGRSWAVMYDLSGLRAGEIARVVIPDWRRLRDELKVTRDAAYQHHLGKPVVAVWGIGFNDHRAYTLEECAELLRVLREEEGGATVMAGVPFYWRVLSRDAVEDPALLRLLEEKADIISPWAVGRYGTPEGARAEIDRVHGPDAAWCAERGKSYLPVIFPGFSWHNLMKSRGQEARLNAIPRRQGRFFWQQAAARIRGGAEMLYVAMFDEMDEATAIFKCTDSVPEGTARFVTNEGLKPDHYLWLTGRIAAALRGEGGPPADTPPERPAAPEKE